MKILAKTEATMHNIYTKKGIYMMEEEDEMESRDAAFMLGFLES